MGRTTIYTQEHRVLAGLLRDLRDEAGLTQVELAERLGRTQTFVAKYETGQRRIDLVSLRSVCRALGVDLVSVAERFERAVEDAVSK